VNRRDGLSYYAEGVNPLKVELLEECLIPGACLDLGCGYGGYAPHIRKICSDLMQVDILDRRGPEYRQIPFTAMDVHHLVFPGRTFENVIAFDVMEHLDDDADMLRRVRELGCKRLVLSVPNTDDEQLRHIQLTHMHQIDKTHRRDYTEAQLQQVLETNGYRVRLMRPHYNSMLFSFAHALAKPNNFLARVAAKTIQLQNRLYAQVGLFENRTIADWFCCAEPLPGA
jgi:SAM-dependent methyltransferase